MPLQTAPRCFDCIEEVSASDAVFEAPCGHDDCPSAVFHGLCLMTWRENREVVFKRLAEAARDYFRRLGE